MTDRRRSKYAYLDGALIGDVFWKETKDAGKYQQGASAYAAKLGMRIEQQTYVALTRRQPYDVRTLVRVEVMRRGGDGS